MTDFRHELRFGVFLTPGAEGCDRLPEQAALAEEAGLDLIGVQDHPYQPALLDAWTLLSYLAARTSRLALVPDVINLPLRSPAVLARSAASLDLLSGGRVELGLGAGYFWDGIAAMGGPRRRPGPAVAALEEAIAVLRALWTPGPPVDHDGEHYTLRGARPGPEPAHRIGLWIGSYGPRMLELTGRLGDGWLPTLAYADPEQVARMSRRIDAAAEAAGRDPGEIVRLYNINGRLSRRAGGGFLDGPPELWAEQLSELALGVGMSGFLLAPGPDTERDLRVFAEEVAPSVREQVAKERAGGGTGEQETHGEEEPGEAPGRAATELRRADGSLNPESRPRLAKGDPEALAPAQRANAERLVHIHDQLRSEMKRIRDAVDQVAAGRQDPAAARSMINQLTIRQNHWTLGGFCAAYCRVVTTHHTIEDQALFPRLRAAQRSLAPVIERLEAEHELIAGVLTGLDAALVAMVEDPDRLSEVRDQVELLDEVLLSHLAYEEEELLEPIGRLNVEV